MDVLDSETGQTEKLDGSQTWCLICNAKVNYEHYISNAPFHHNS